MGKFVITKKNNEEFRYNLKENSRKTILINGGYTSRVNCLSGIDAVKTNALDNSKFDKKTAANGSLYFNLKADNGQIIGISEMYQNIQARDNAIESVKVHAPSATTKDLTE